MEKTKMKEKSLEGMDLIIMFFQFVCGCMFFWSLALPLKFSGLLPIFGFTSFGVVFMVLIFNSMQMDGKKGGRMKVLLH